MNLDNKVTSAAPSTGSSINQTSVSKTPQHTLGSVSNYGEAAPAKQVFVHQIIRGEVTDLRNNEITMTLPDNTQITGKLTNGSMYSIGDTASLRISSVYPQLVLEAIPSSITHIENATIQKALDAAGLPKSEKNQAVVRELMKHNMPIHKQGIQTILQQSYHFPNAQIRSLVLMNQLNIEINDKNVTQMENYSSKSRFISDKADALAESIPNLLEAVASKVDTPVINTLGTRLMDILLEPPAKEVPVDSRALSEILSERDREALFHVFKDAFLNVSENNSSFEEALQKVTASVQDGTISLRDTIHLLNQAKAEALTIDQANYERIILERVEQAEATGKTADMEMLQNEASSLPKLIDQFDRPIVHELMEYFKEEQYQNNEIGYFLSPENRKELLHNLKDFPLDNEMKDAISSGELTKTKLLQGIQKSLSLVSSQSAAKLFQSDSFKMLFREQIISGWSRHPEQLRNKKDINDLFENIRSQTQKLEQFLTNSLGKTEIGSQMAAGARDIHQSLDFMQLLNQYFPYVQIPLKLHENTAHSELYVYTRKKGAAKENSSLSALLHLDLDALGALDVHVTLNQQNVSTVFYTTERASTQLLKTHVNELSEALSAKGYLLTADFKQREQEINPIHDFLDKEQTNTTVTRYTFDIRA